eukprot:365224-Chlamydomonas_euryale.AAC.4
MCVKWQGKEFAVELAPDASVSDLKRELEARTTVAPKRQKLLGLKRKDGKPAGDDDALGDLALKPGAKVMLMG